jgi:hypothetical protein
MFQWAIHVVYIPNVLFVSDVCCKCFIWMLQNLDRDVAFICKCFYTYVASVSSRCSRMFAMAARVFSSFFLVFCKCFILMLQVLAVLDVYCKYFI